MDQVAKDEWATPGFVYRANYVGQCSNKQSGDGCAEKITARGNHILPDR